MIDKFDAGPIVLVVEDIEETRDGIEAPLRPLPLVFAKNSPR